MKICPTCGTDKDVYRECGCESHNLVGVDYPEDGFGIFSRIRDFKYPFPMLIDGRIVDNGAVFKRSLINIIRYFPFNLLFKKRFKKWFKDSGNTAFHNVGFDTMDKNRFCRSGREIYRVMEIVFDWMIAKIVAFLWEYDVAYRFPGQDVLGEFNKENFKCNPRKEILRLIDIGISRELLFNEKDKNSFDRKKKWIYLRKIFSVAWYISPSLRKTVKQIFNEINIDAIKFDEIDSYWINFRYDYNYRGLSYEERIKEFDKMNEGFVPVPVVAEVRTSTNKQFFELSEEGARKMLNDMVNSFMSDAFLKEKGRLENLNNEKISKESSI